MKNPLLDPINSGEESVQKKDQPQPQPIIIPFLPDDIIICILKRLDVRDIVARCRFVCKNWNKLISNPHFQDSLMPSSLPMIYTSTYWPLALDKWWETNYYQFTKIGSDVTYPDFSQNGFILSRTRNVKLGYEYMVCNPVTREQVKIVLPENLPHLSPVIFGIYFHPIQNEYCTLWQTWVNDPNVYGQIQYRRYVFDIRGELHMCYGHIQYKMLILKGSNSEPPLWRNIGDPLDHWCEADRNACLVNGFMYWLADDKKKKICFAFNIKTENLTQMMPLPYVDDYKLYPLSLVINGEGCLNLVQLVVDCKDIKVKIWTPKDGIYWTASQSVCYLNLWGIKHHPRAIAIANRQLIFEALVGKQQHDNQLFVCNVIQSKPGTLRRLNREGNRHPLKAKFWAYHPTVASLRNCQPVIHM